MAIAIFFSFVVSTLGNELHIAKKFFLTGKRIELASEKHQAVSATSALLAFVNQNGKQVVIGGERISIDLASEKVTVTGWAVIRIDGKSVFTPPNYSEPNSFEVYPDGRISTLSVPSVILNDEIIDSRKQMFESLESRMTRFLESVPAFATVTNRKNKPNKTQTKP